MAVENGDGEFKVDDDQNHATGIAGPMKGVRLKFVAEHELGDPMDCEACRLGGGNMPCLPCMAGERRDRRMGVWAEDTEPTASPQP